MISLFAMTLALSIAATDIGTPRFEPEPDPVGLAKLHRLDLLPRFKNTVSFGAVTSYDRTEGNDDGFSGKYSFVRKEGDDLVLADLPGPGCIYRIHTPSPTDSPLEFFFDGETEPRLRTTFLQLYSGQQAPFVRPLVDIAGGGYTCYVPIPYQKSCKIVLRAKSFQFYDLNYATYPKDADVQTYDPAKTAADKQGIARASALFASDLATDLRAFTVPSGTAVRTLPFEKKLEPGRSVTLFEARKGGRIVGLRVGPASAFQDKERSVLLKVTWDDSKTPAILCPVGDFFGYAWGKPAMGSVLAGTYRGENYINLPMPFRRSAKIELVSLAQGGNPILVRGQAAIADIPQRDDEGQFYAVWNRENPTTEGKPYTFLSTKGKGHIVGLVLQAQGPEPGNTGFFEGDDLTIADGEMKVHGTGSEDFFNGGWYEVPGRWDGPVSRPLSGCLAYQKHLGRTGGYRFFLGDAYSFSESITQTIEHAPTENKMVCDYASVTYLYCDRPPVQPELPSLERRRIADPERVVMSAHWTMPIASFALNNATISRKNVAFEGGSARCLTFRPSAGDFFGPPFVALIADVPSAGRYKVYLNLVRGPDSGIVGLHQGETPVGEPVDLYAAKPTLARDVLAGEIEAVEGSNTLMFKLVGRNPASAATGFDLSEVVLVRVK